MVTLQKTDLVAGWSMEWNEEDKRTMDHLIEKYGYAGILKDIAERCDIALLTSENEMYFRYSTALWQLLGVRPVD
jgi:hypothetical protein